MGLGFRVQGLASAKPGQTALNFNANLKVSNPKLGSQTLNSAGLIPEGRKISIDTWEYIARSREFYRTKQACSKDGSSQIICGLT